MFQLSNDKKVEDEQPAETEVKARIVSCCIGWEDSSLSCEKVLLSFYRAFLASILPVFYTRALLTGQSVFNINRNWSYRRPFSNKNLLSNNKRPP